MEIHKGSGTDVEIHLYKPQELIIIDEDFLIDMIRTAFDCPDFTIDKLLDAIEPRT